jgi:hypothetical protein
MDYDKTNQTYWVALSDGSFKKYDINFNLLSTFTNACPYGITFISDICVTDAYILLSYRGASQVASNYRAAIVAYNKSDGTYSKTIDITSTTSYYISLSSLKDKGKVLVRVGDVNGTIMVLNENDLSIMSSILGNIGSFSNSSILASSSCYLRWDDDTQLLITNAAGNVAVCYLVPAFAHTLLASPVTKTSTNTMKIQYDLTVDYVYPLDMPAH